MPYEENKVSIDSKKKIKRSDVRTKFIKCCRCGKRIKIKEKDVSNPFCSECTTNMMGKWDANGKWIKLFGKCKTAN